MKRIIKLMAGDVRFQIKYGFYLLYAFFTFLYIAILYILPSAWKSDATTLVIYSDPALLGLIFVGVIVL
ncbi:MAG: ABC transporter, partial [Prevotellaceae bacterium]|nr:ABC transporter [Prevotellaceae bacterium]